MNDISKPQAAVKINELEKFAMFMNAPGAEGKRSKLSWYIREGSPRITVYTNIPSDTINRGAISAAMNPETALIFLDLFEKGILDNNAFKYKLECFTTPWSDTGERLDKKVTSELWFGKDNTGMVWISILSDNRPKIKFEFKISDWHRIFHADGTQFTEVEGSVLQAMAVIKAMRNIITSHASIFRQPPQPQTAKPSADSFVSSPAPKGSEFDDVF